MLSYTEEQIDKIVKVISDKNIRWATGRVYGTNVVPLGWTIKKEPTDASIIMKFLLKENKELKLKVEELERKLNNV